MAVGIVSISFLTNDMNNDYLLLFITLAGVFLFLSNWSVSLPSGAAWRPASYFVILGIFLLPPSITPLAAYPGLIYITAKSKKSFLAYGFTFGHTSLSLFAGSFLFRSLDMDGALTLPSILPVAFLVLVVHLLVNRLIATINIAYKYKKSLRSCVVTIFSEVNWGHINGYIATLITAIIYKLEGPWGLLVMFMLLVGVYRSVTYYSDMNSWKKFASTDGLTGIPNRAAWETFVKSMEEKPSSGTLAFIDLDDFKRVNDLNGHLVGDRLLREIADILQNSIRKTDNLFRYGGDEFIVFFSHHISEGPKVHERITQILNQITQKCEEFGTTGASIGIVNVDQRCDINELLSLSDRCMYENKLHKKTRGVSLTTY